MLKGRWMATVELRDKAAASIAERELAEATDELTEATHHWIDEHDQSVAGAGLDPSSLKELVAVATRASDV